MTLFRRSLSRSIAFRPAWCSRSTRFVAQVGSSPRLTPGTRSGASRSSTTATSAEVEQRTFGRRDRDAFGHRGVGGVERLGLVHDELVVARPPPPRARDLLDRPPTAGEAPERRRRAMRRDGPEASRPARRQQVALPGRRRTRDVVSLEMPMQPATSRRAVHDLSLGESQHGRVSGGEDAVMCCCEPSEGLIGTEHGRKFSRRV
jgi:hypothetical protein